jgi:hypothetical protein
MNGNEKVGDIRIDTSLSPKTLSKYLRLLSKQRLITFPKNWKRGKPKHCLITDDGIKWLVNVPLNENLQVLLKIADQLKNPKTREIYKKAQSEKFSRDTKIIKDHFIEKSLKHEEPLQENLSGLNLTDPDQPFRDVLKKLFSLHLYITSNFDTMPEQVESNVGKDFILFYPNMRFAFSWHPGAFPDLEHQIQNADNCFLQSIMEEKRFEREKMNNNDTHLLDLEKVDEKCYKEYLNAQSSASRNLILLKIEDQVGWSVGKYLKEILLDKEAEMAKYVEVLHRPFLSKFISSFEK